MPRDGAGIYSLPSGGSITLGNLARSPQIMLDLNDIAAALNSGGFVGPAGPNSVSYAVDTGVVNALIASTAATSFAYIAGAAIDVLVGNTNTTTVVTINVVGLGVKTVTDIEGLGPTIGTLVAGNVYRFVYDGTVFRVQQINNKVKYGDMRDYGAAVGVDCAAIMTTTAALISNLIFPSGAWVINSLPTIPTGVMITALPGASFTGAGAATLGLSSTSHPVSFQYTDFSAAGANNELATINVFRNATAAGGSGVSAGIRVQANVGAAVVNNEWPLLSILNNSAPAGQHAAMYAQGNKMTGGGQTWAGVCEFHDRSGASDPTSGSVGLEVDMFADGTDANGLRIALDIVGGIGVSVAPTIFAGGRIGPFNGVNANATFVNGMLLRGVMTRAINISTSGASQIGVDTSLATLSGAAFRMASGQPVAFEGTSSKTLRYNAATAGLVYASGGVDKITLTDIGGITHVGSLNPSGNRVYAGAVDITNTYMFQSGGSISGQASQGPGGSISPYYFYIGGDTVDTTTLAGGSPALLRMFSQILGVSAGHTGGRTGIYGSVIIVGTPGLSPAGLPGYVALEGLCQCNANLTGTGGAYTNYQGTIYGANPWARTVNGATFLHAVVTQECDISVAYGSSTARKNMMTFNKTVADYMKGDYDDTAVVFADQTGLSSAAAAIPITAFVAGRAFKIQTVGTSDFTLIGSLNNTVGTVFTATGAGTGTGTGVPDVPPWTYGIGFGAYGDGQWPFDATSSIIYAQPRVLGIPGALTVQSIEQNRAYKIAALGTTSAATWHALGVPAAVTPAVGVIFIAARAGLSTDGNGNTTRGYAVANIGVDWTNVLFNTAAFKSPGFNVDPSGVVTGAAGVFNGYAYTPTVSIAFSATPTIDASQGNVFEIGALTGNITALTISSTGGFKNGQTITIRYKQDGTGGRTVATPTGAKITGSVTLTANTACLETLTYSAMDSRWEGSFLSLPT